jgi:hypothetical protein
LASAFRASSGIAVARIIWHHRSAYLLASPQRGGA